MFCLYKRMSEVKLDCGNPHLFAGTVRNAWNYVARKESYTVYFCKQTFKRNGK